MVHTQASMVIEIENLNALIIYSIIESCPVDNMTAAQKNKIGISGK